MDDRLRRLFNAAYAPGVAEALRRAMSAACETPEFPFRLAETPVLFSRELRDLSLRTAREIVEEMGDPATIARCAERIPERYCAPATDRLPHMAIVDLAIVRGAEGALAPRLIECQGFPSLYAMQVVMADAWGEILSRMPGMPRAWSVYGEGPGGEPLDRASYLDLLRRTIVADCDPEEVVLVDIDPASQKTRPDFVAARRLLGVREVCATRLVRRGDRLYAPRSPDGAGGLAPVRRLYHRVVFDELAAKGLALPFDYRERLDLAWVPHPNWYWIWSKATIPFLDHPAVPEAHVLSEVERLPDDLSRFVLKPLFSFAGRGVVVDVDRAAIDAIPEAERRDWLLMEKVDYAPDLVAPEGARVKVELRILCLRPDGETALAPAVNLCRLSRGKMHGVDHNKGLDWVGSSIAIWPAE